MLTNDCVKCKRMLVKKMLILGTQREGWKRRRKRRWEKKAGKRGGKEGEKQGRKTEAPIG